MIAHAPARIDSPPVALQAIDKARRLLAKASTLDEVKLIRDQAEAVRVYAKASQAGLEMQNSAAEIRILAERRAGELLAVMPKSCGGRPSETSNTMLQVSLDDLGISRMQSHRWQRLALVPEETFSAHVAAVKETGKELTTAGVARLAETPTKPAPAFSLPAEMERVRKFIDGARDHWPREHWVTLANLLCNVASQIEAELSFTDEDETDDS